MPYSPALTVQAAVLHAASVMVNIGKGTHEAPDLRVSDLAQVLEAIDRILERHHLTIAEFQRLQRRLRQIETQMAPSEDRFR